MYEERAEQKERREIIAAERKPRQGDGEPQTFFARARAGLDDDLPTGRYAQQAHFSGQEPCVGYPAASAWTRDAAMVPNEEPTGIDINALEPVGTFAEVQRSELAADPSVIPTGPFSQMSPVDGIGGHPPPASALSPRAEEASSPCDPTVAAGSVPAASSPEAVDRGDEAISLEDEQRLKALLGRGLRRRKI
jgi:hypothetical protein